MKIYSIKEIVEATNSFLKPKSENIVKDKNLTKQIKLTNENQVKTKNTKESNFKEDEKIQIKDTTKPIKIKLSPLNKKKEAPLINKIKFEPKVKDIIVNELYIFLKKKIRKSTLKIIIDEQIEIKNLKREITFVKVNEKKLINNYKSLKVDYKEITKNYEKIKSDKKELEENLNLTTNQKNKLTTENDELENNN